MPRNLNGIVETNKEQIISESDSSSDCDTFSEDEKIEKAI